MVDPSYAESWMSQPDVCRCCLSASGTWDVTVSYVTEAGENEVYSEMLQECYGITLSNLQQFGPSRMVCALCVSHLRNANNFRKQVVLADQQFAAYTNARLRVFKPVVLLKSDTPHPRRGSSESDINSDEGTIDVLAITDCQETDATVVDRVSGKKKSKVKKNIPNTDVEENVESDTPMSEISRKPHVPDSIDGRTEAGNDSDSVLGAKVKSKSFIFARPQNVVKQISERKRIILTCAVVLRETNACPFRHHKSWFQCFFCQQDFFEINLLRSHTVTSHSNIDEELKKIKRYPRSLQIEISNLECRLCNLNLTDVSSMRRHFFDVHKKVIYNECIADYKVNASPYSCHLCGQQFHAFRSLTTHLNEHYANCICDVCGKSFINSKRLKVHKRTHENGEFPCNECGKILTTKTSQANHIESVHFKRIIKCQICFKPMKHYNDRIKHMSEVHNITHKFKCHICSREYNVKHYLATHIRQTHGNKNKKCLECGMAFITNHGLKKHMLKHTGVKPYSCDVCCKSYARSYTLREHMKTHENELFLAPE